METIELWPFAQGEIDGRPDRFIDAVFSLAPICGTYPVSGAPTTPSVLCGAASRIGCA
jgi:hypothetical protein